MNGNISRLLDPTNWKRAFVSMKTFPPALPKDVGGYVGLVWNMREGGLLDRGRWCCLLPPGPMAARGLTTLASTLQPVHFVMARSYAVLTCVDSAKIL